MPEKKPAVSFDSIMRDIKAGKFAPLYVLMGEESFYIDQISNAIQKTALEPSQQAFDQTVVFGADVNGAQIADFAMQFPMMAPRKVIIVKEAQAMKGLDKLDKYAAKPNPKTVLVICYKNGKPDRRTKFMTSAERNGVVFESKKIKEWQLPPRVKAYLAKNKVSIDDKSAEMIAGHIGSDLNRLKSELDKLIVALPEDNRRVTPDVVEKNIGISKDFNTFELRDAIVKKQVLKANRIIKYFDSNPKAGNIYSVLPLLFNYFQNLMLAYYAPNRNNPQALADYLGLKNSWGVKDYTEGLRNYTGRKTMQILEKLRETDAKSKGLGNVSTSEGDLMKELVFFILH